MQKNFPPRALPGPLRKSVSTKKHDPAITAAVPRASPFTMIFVSVLGLTLICLFTSLYVSFHMDAGAKNLEAMKSLNEKLLSVFTLGCGAIIGLLGGKNFK
jgi:hypothetical protein